MSIRVPARPLFPAQLRSKRSMTTLLLGVLILSTTGLGPSRAWSEQPAEKWRLTWSDEFEGEAIDRRKWDFDLGNGFYDYNANQWIRGWGNEELQYYTGEPENAFVKGGVLHIRALKQSLHGCGYTSARMKTRKRDGQPLFNQRYGRFEFRAKLPTGQGVWPALWMMSQDEKFGTWPASGEIDVMEARGQQPNQVLGTLHYGSRWPNNAHTSGRYQFPQGQSIAEFHVYAIEWEPGEFRWYVDGKQYAVQRFWWSSSKMEGAKGAVPQSDDDLNEWPAPFNQRFYLIMNLAIGGKFLGNPDASTPFPAEMQVDYVRVYEKVGGYGKAGPRGPGKFPFTK